MLRYWKVCTNQKPFWACSSPEPASASCFPHLSLTPDQLPSIYIHPSNCTCSLPACKAVPQKPCNPLFYAIAFSHISRVIYVSPERGSFCCRKQSREWVQHQITKIWELPHKVLHQCHILLLCLQHPCPTIFRLVVPVINFFNITPSKFSKHFWKPQGRTCNILERNIFFTTLRLISWERFSRKSEWHTQQQKCDSKPPVKGHFGAFLSLHITLKRNASLRFLFQKLGFSDSLYPCFPPHFLPLQYPLPHPQPVHTTFWSPMKSNPGVKTLHNYHNW